MDGGEVEAWVAKGRVQFAGLAVVAGGVGGHAFLLIGVAEPVVFVRVALCVHCAGGDIAQYHQQRQSQKCRTGQLPQRARAAAGQ